MKTIHSIKFLILIKKYFIQKASFVDENRILFGLLSNQVGVYNLSSKQNEIFFMQVSHSSFSHFKLSKDKKSFASTDESGVVRIFNTQDGTLIKKTRSIKFR